MAETNPVSYPIITLDGVPYSLIFDNSAYVTLHELGLEMEDVVKSGPDGKPLPMKASEAADRALKLIAAGISHQVTLTPKQIGRMKGASQPADLKGIFEKISEALVKAADQAKAGSLVPETSPQLQ